MKENDYPGFEEKQPFHKFISTKLKSPFEKKNDNGCELSDIYIRK